MVEFVDIWADDLLEQKQGCVSIRFGDFSISITKFSRFPEIIVFPTDRRREWSPTFAADEPGLREAIAWIDEQREKIDG